MKVNKTSKGNAALWIVVIVLALIAIPQIFGGNDAAPVNTVPNDVPAQVDEYSPSSQEFSPGEQPPSVGEETGRITREKVDELKETGKALKDGPGTKAAEGTKKFVQDFRKEYSNGN